MLPNTMIARQTRFSDDHLSMGSLLPRAKNHILADKVVRNEERTSMSAITNRQMNKNERQVLPAKTTANLKKRNRKQFEADRIEENQTA